MSIWYSVLRAYAQVLPIVNGSREIAGERVDVPLHEIIVVDIPHQLARLLYLVSWRRKRDNVLFKSSRRIIG